MKKPSSASTPSNRALATLRSVLLEIGWEPQKEGDTEGFVVQFDPPQVPVANAYAAISAQLEVFVIYLNFGVAVARDRYGDVADFICLVNSNLMIGNFEIDFEDGQFRFRSGLCFAGTELSAELIRKSILFSMNAVERYGVAAVEVITKGKTASQAFQEAEDSLEI